MSRLAGNGCEFVQPAGDLKPLAEIEKALIKQKQFRRKCWSPFTKGIKEFKLINEGDSVAVAVSGGKDSVLMAKLMQELQKHGKIPFTVKFISMDPGFHESNRKLLTENCEYLNIPIHLFDRNLFNVVDDIASDYPCYLCARMRRGALYATAQELGCNKLALGHHFDDVIETIMLNVLCAGKYQTMMPKLKANNFEGLELIRPMYFLREDSIKEFTSWAGLRSMNCGCVVAAKKTSSKRREIKELIKTLGKTFRDVDKCIYQSSRNVYQDAILEWVDGKDRTNFLDGYNEPDPKSN